MRVVWLERFVVAKTSSTIRVRRVFVVVQLFIRWCPMRGTGIFARRVQEPARLALWEGRALPFQIEKWHPLRQQLEIARSVDPLVCAAWDGRPWADDEARVNSDDACNSGLGIAGFSRWPRHRGKTGVSTWRVSQQNRA